jgi:hypothetical protein
MANKGKYQNTYHNYQINTYNFIQTGLTPDALVLKTGQIGLNTTKNINHN